MCVCSYFSAQTFLCVFFVFGYLNSHLSNILFLKNLIYSQIQLFQVSLFCKSVSLFHQRYYLGQIFCKNFIAFSSLAKHAPSEVHFFVFRQIQENFN